MIEIGKILSKTDAFLAKNDYKGAEHLLEYWAAEAKGRDLIPILNELLGLYRKTRQKAKALQTAEKEESLLLGLGLENTPSGATIHINIATVYSAFAHYQKALKFYEKAEQILDRANTADNKLRASLYNNMGTCLSFLGCKNKAYAYLFLALSSLKAEKESELDRAITYLNLADLALYAENDRNKEAEFLNEAEALIMEPSLKRDGYYAFVAEKCAPGFRAHGREELSDKLLAEAKGIYERN
jgi:hypothetical protein